MKDVIIWNITMKLDQIKHVLFQYEDTITENEYLEISITIGN